MAEIVKMRKDVMGNKLRWDYLVGYFDLHRGQGLPLPVLDNDLLLK
jgi:hypothetical protein